MYCYAAGPEGIDAPSPGAGGFFIDQSINDLKLETMSHYGAMLASNDNVWIFETQYIDIFRPGQLPNSKNTRSS